MKINEKAVSEAIGFILILGIVISGIGLVTLYGYPVLVKEQSNTDVKNMERAMIVIQNDMKSLCFKNVPYKETSLQVSGGTLAVIGADPSTPGFSISAKDFGPIEFHPGALVYRSDRGTEVITLENGAVMTRQEDARGSAMLAEPRWFYDVDTTTTPPTTTFVVYIMNISTDEPMAKSGMTTVRMSLENMTIHKPPGDAESVIVEYPDDADNSVAWKNYLTGSSLKMDDSGGTYTRSDVMKLVVKEYEIKIHGI
ncbi:MULTISPECIES: hypothetical protein [unclassified Methanoculleus]|uniref:DUF7289 family protein n=1 Tax=unclassified Methanoculleus TaxID=2619537 RepID=UPI0025EA536D|nr:MULTISPECIES: hypothetical protein [unclassified Methanoculleus]MCK9318526.1 hypothetical protein [Methanoculleus sp.]MDD2254367.1 hypothetical protein [Methanoculleus sp.]MDD2787023.1 hypothetical protein [Methanoculleus sp.]MDD3215185.1 hypothetical protein [Methanoculleus sp.]MDD4314907.1 hypothetical protein [Methanoculleus sp.]